MRTRKRGWCINNWSNNSLPRRMPMTIIENEIADIALSTWMSETCERSTSPVECAQSGKRLGEYLVDQGIVSEHDLTSCLSNQLGFLFVDLAREALNPELSSTIPEPLAKRYQAVPLRQEGKSLTVAMDNPLDFEAIQDISFFSGCAVKPVLAARSVIKEALEKIYVKQEIEVAIDRITGDSTEEFSEELLDVLSDTDHPTEAEIQTLEEETRRAPIVR